MGKLLDSHIIDLDQQGFSILLDYTGYWRDQDLQGQATRIFRQDRNIKQVWVELGKPSIVLVGMEHLETDEYDASHYTRFDYRWKGEGL